MLAWCLKTLFSSLNTVLLVFKIFLYWDLVHSGICEFSARPLFMLFELFSEKDDFLSDIRDNIGHGVQWMFSLSLCYHYL